MHAVIIRTIMHGYSCVVFLIAFHVCMNNIITFIIGHYCCLHRIYFTFIQSYINNKISWYKTITTQ